MMTSNPLKIVVETTKKYDILIGKNILKNSYNYIKDITESNQIIIICDSKIKYNHLPLLIKSLEKHYKIHVIIINVSEKIKSLPQAMKLCSKILKLQVDRKTLVIALGGGVIGDLVGFCTSIILRGLPFILIPTTLLSQVDSSIGGKTGVNTPYGKNTIGTFKQPSRVLIDPNTLKTLTFKNYISGYSEALKYALLFDNDYYNYLLQKEKEIKKLNSTTLLTIIEKSCNYKALVVKEDEFENNNIRALLNLGHTFGHALEKYNNYKNSLLHGEAVAIGMVLAFDFANFIQISNINTLQLKQHLINVGLPTKISDVFNKININKMLNFMLLDKKNYNHQITLILPKDIGKCAVYKDIDFNLLKDFLISKI